MIINIILTQPTSKVPVNNQHYINGYFHKLLGENNKWHDSFTDYAVSSLQGGHLVDGYLVFNDNPFITISSENQEFINSVINGALSSDAEVFGMKFKTLDFKDYNVNQYYDKVYTISPILIKKDGKKISVRDEEFLDTLTNNCKAKLKHKGIVDDTFKLEIRNLEKAKVKKIMVGDVFNICSMVSLVVYGKKKTRSTLYNMGLGNSTGCGFGTVKISYCS